MSDEVDFLDSESVEYLQFREIGKHIVQTRHDKEDYVRVRWLLISNVYGYVVVGKPTSFLFIKTENVFESLKKDQDVDKNEIIEVNMQEHTNQHTKLSKLALSLDELTIAAIIGNKVLLFDTRSINAKVKPRHF